MQDLGLIEAVKAGDLAEVDRLIGAGADLNQQDEQGWTPLNFAAGKGDLELVKRLVNGGADVFKTGRDHRTPYMIALAAGRLSVVKFLREVEDSYPGEKPARPPRQYCKAYHLGDLRQYPAWSEGRINWKQKPNGQGSEAAFDEESVVFIHQDFTVTESMWHNENVIFNQVTPDWEAFCVGTLQFRVPDDIDLIATAEAHG
ncbi:MAG TPA: ankyrin repeat domain-containing protein [Blastocatellia bacterium]|nr:ankyrin repeat domain-containing protein [Blastocatellia bacterium]